MDAVLGQDDGAEDNTYDMATAAAWSLEVVRWLLDKDSSGRVESLLNIPLPKHYLRRLNVFSIPKPMTIDDVLKQLAVDKGDLSSHRPIHFRLSKCVEVGGGAGVAMRGL